MRVHKASLALATFIAALVGLSIADTASASDFGYYQTPGGRYDDAYAYRAPQPNQSLPGAAPRPSNRDTRGAPSMGGRGMRGGGRVNGGMGRR